VSQISTDGRGTDQVAPEEDSSNGSAGADIDILTEDAPQGRRALTGQQKKVLAVALVVHLVVATFTLRDLRRRSADAVRGPKGLWRLWAMLNTSGSLAYWLFGRRTPA
jgi:hypothetical protein